MVVCKFFLEGNCRFGTSCRNEHPAGLNSQNQFNNRIGFNNNSNNSNAQTTNFGMNNLRNGPFRSRQDNKRRTYDLDADRIRADFTKERPIWPFSSYGPTVDQPRQLIEGDVELSPEEMRCRAYLVRAQGKPQSEINEMEATANSKMSKVVQNIMSDTMSAIRYVQRGEEEHPNRWDVIQASVEGGLDKLQAEPSSQTPFGQSPNAAQTSSSPFGAPSNTLGKPSFGQASLPGASPFGAPSNPGASPFGQPSATNPSPFAQANTNSSPFGQLSKPTNQPFGQPTTNTASPFGQAGASTTTPAFAQSSSLGNNNSPFGKPSLPGAPAFGQPSNFGQPSSLNNASPFSSGSPFGKLGVTNAPTGPAAMGNTSDNMNPSPFASTGQNNTNNDNSSPFAVKQPSNASPFGGSSNPFGGNAGFNQGNQAGNPFSQDKSLTPSISSVNAPFSTQSSTISTAGRPNSSSFIGNSPFASNSISVGSLNIASNTKIFPTGIPTAPLCEDPPAYQYGGNEAVYKEAYDTIKQGGVFSGGVMPMVAPKWEWVSFQL